MINKMTRREFMEAALGDAGIFATRWQGFKRAISG